MSARDIFNKAVALQDGEQLLIPCHDSRQQESLRVSLSVQRRYFIEQTTVNFDILISKLTRDGKPCVILSKKPRLDTGLVVSADGSVRTISLRPDPVSNITGEAMEIERIRTAMRQDGYDEAAIAKFLESGEIASQIDTCLAPDKEE